MFASGVALVGTLSCKQRQGAQGSHSLCQLQERPWRGAFSNLGLVHIMFASGVVIVGTVFCKQRQGAQASLANNCAIAGAKVVAGLSGGGGRQRVSRCILVQGYGMEAGLVDVVPGTRRAMVALMSAFSPCFSPCLLVFCWQHHKMRTRVLLIAAAACGLAHALHIEPAALRPLHPTRRAAQAVPSTPALKASSVAGPSNSDALRLKGVGQVRHKIVLVSCSFAGCRDLFCV